MAGSEPNRSTEIAAGETRDVSARRLCLCVLSPWPLCPSAQSLLCPPAVRCDIPASPPLTALSARAWHMRALAGEFDLHAVLLLDYTARSLAPFAARRISPLAVPGRLPCVCTHAYTLPPPGLRPLPSPQQVSVSLRCTSPANLQVDISAISRSTMAVKNVPRSGHLMRAHAAQSEFISNRYSHERQKILTVKGDARPVRSRYLRTTQSQ